MENFKMNVDRPKISSEEIASRQNFDSVLSQFKQIKPPAYKNPWFWGSAGLASAGLTTLLTLNAFTLKNETNDKKITQKTELPNDTDCIKPPVKEENIPFSSYEVNPQQDQTIVLPSGTTIEIDKGSLLAQNPNEKVEIKVREFHDQASVFISGIPMDYKKDAFESAGMIEIKGEQDGREVKINPEKPIEIELKTTENPADFGFWYLNQEAKSWEKYPAVANKANSSTDLRLLKKEIRQAEQKIEQNASQIRAVEKEIARVHSPKKEEYKIPGENTQLFDLDFDKSDYPELAAFNSIVFEVVHPNGHDPLFEKNSKKTWNDVRLQKSGDKYIALFSNKNDNYNVQVRPVLKGKELKDAEREFDLVLEKSKKTKAEFDREKQRLESEKKAGREALKALIDKQVKEQELMSANRYSQLIQTSEEIKQAEDNRRVNAELNSIQDFSSSVSFRTTSWGVFNSDKPIVYPEPMTGGVALVWVGSQVAKFKQLFVFNRDKNLRFSYGEGFRSLDLLGFHRNDDLVLVGIDFEGNVGYCEIRKQDPGTALQKISFNRKDKSTKTLDLLKSLMDETTAAV